MKCPHCSVAFFETWSESELMRGPRYRYETRRQFCPECQGPIIFLETYDLSAGGGAKEGWLVKQEMVYPKGASRAPLSPEVPDPYRRDYTEAAAVLQDSAKASAALSRRLLQMILRDKAGVKKSELSKEIDEILASGKLPSQLADAIDAVRNVGNFAAHPLKSTNTGEVLDVEPGEAEWLLDVIDGFLDLYFVQPAILQKKKEALNKKLAEAGKPPMK